MWGGAWKDEMISPNIIFFHIVLIFPVPGKEDKGVTELESDLT
jgi:hypothetical protein